MYDDEDEDVDAGDVSLMDVVQGAALALAFWATAVLAIITLD